MALLVYKYQDYENTAEREQFRVLCRKLYNLYSQKEELCLFIANYNIYDCELDGIIIKPDAIIAIELKNYGGNIIATDNGNWTLSDGTVIKGGSRKTVYQQARLNHVAIKRGFKDGGITKTSNLKDVSTLIVFNQDITLDNRLSSRTRSWLHITDNSRFLEKIEDITSKHTILSNVDILQIVQRLGIYDIYRCDEYCTDNENVQNGANISSSTPKSEAIKVKMLIEEILSLLGFDKNCIVTVYEKALVESLFQEKGFELDKKYVITLSSQNQAKTLAVIKEECRWGAEKCGDLVFWEFDLTELPNIRGLLDKLRCKKMSVQNVSLTLPRWLDDYIYSDLSGVFCKSNCDMVVIDWNKSDILNYLGTYFPRSYTEAYCIISQYLEVSNTLEDKKEISIFDFGCGTGGEIIGAVTAIIEKAPQIQHINIMALDGNYNALRIFEKVLNKFCTKSSTHISHTVIPLEIDDFYDLSVLDSVLIKKFDIVLSFKAICEFVSKQRFEEKNAYAHLVKFFLPRTNPDGFLLLADVTTYNDVSQEWLPEMMDKGLSEVNCDVVAKNTGYNQPFFVTHSHKKNDISKIAWRLIMNNK